MTTDAKPLLSLTAADLMTQNLVQFTEDMPLREAARRLVSERITGAPVVDSQGVCVGVLSSTDFLHLLVNRRPRRDPASIARPISCSHQRPYHAKPGDPQSTCTLPPGACAVQVDGKGPDGDEVLLCNEPHCVFADWQVVEVEELPDDQVRFHMTGDPVTVSADEGIQRLAHRMINAGVHRVIVVDGQNHPIGIVSGTDILAAVSYAEPESHSQETNTNDSLPVVK